MFTPRFRDCAPLPCGERSAGAKRRPGEGELNSRLRAPPGSYPAPHRARRQLHRSRNEEPHSPAAFNARVRTASGTLSACWLPSNSTIKTVTPAGEIDDVRPDPNLSAEVVAVQKSIAKLEPQQMLSVCRPFRIRLASDLRANVRLRSEGPLTRPLRGHLLPVGERNQSPAPRPFRDDDRRPAFFIQQSPLSRQPHGTARRSRRLPIPDRFPRPRCG